MTRQSHVERSTIALERIADSLEMMMKPVRIQTDPTVPQSQSKSVIGITTPASSVPKLQEPAKEFEDDEVEPLGADEVDED